MTEIAIRRATAADYVAVAQIYRQPKAQSGTLQVPYSAPELWQNRLEGEGVYALVACAGDDLVGQIGLNTFLNVPRRRHVGQIGMAVRDDWQGKGVGTLLLGAVVDLADNWLNLTRLELEVFADNAGAIHLYEKFGFEKEGVLKQFAFREGQYADVWAMGRLRSIAV